MNCHLNKHYYLFFLAFLFLLFSESVLAQNARPISLIEAKNLVKENNISLKIQLQEYQTAKANYQQTRAVILPKITLSNTSAFTNNPLNAFGFKLLQQRVTSADFNPDLLNDPGNVENFNTKIEIIQPLINVDGWNARKAANLQMEAQNLTAERKSDYLEYEIEQIYFQLQLAYQQKDVLEKALLAATDNKNNIQNRFDEGLIQNSDLLDVNLRVNDIQNQLQYSQSNIQNTSEYFSFLIGEDGSQLFIPKDKMDMNKTERPELFSFNSNRSDIQAIENNVEAQEQMLKSSKSSFIPRANAFANYEWNDVDFLGFEADNYFVGLQLSWDIFNGGKNLGKINYEKAQLEKANLNKEQYISQSKLEINKVKRQLIDAQNSIQLTQLAKEQSKESLRIKTDRFNEGLEKTSDVLMAETKFQEKELEFYQAVYNYNQTLAYLKFLTK